MLDRVWNSLKSTWNALPQWLSITIANTAHQIAHIALMFVDGLKCSFVGHGILISLGWTIKSTNYIYSNNSISTTPTYYATSSINYLGFMDIVSDILGTAMVAIPYCSVLVICYSFIWPKNTLQCRDKWLTHALLSMLPLALICGGTSALGALTLGASAMEVAHSAAASIIGTWVFSIPTTVFTIMSFKQFCGLYKRHSQHHNPVLASTSVLKRLKNNAMHEAINIGILYGIGISSSLIGLGILYRISSFKPIVFLNTFLGDLTGISVLTIPLGIFYCSINTFIQKKDALTERPARARHSALRLGPTSIGMPIMTLLGTYICFGNSNLSVITAGNAIGVLIISGITCGVMTCTNQIVKRVYRSPQAQEQTIEDGEAQTTPPAVPNRPQVIVVPPGLQFFNYVRPYQLPLHIPPRVTPILAPLGMCQQHTPPPAVVITPFVHYIPEPARPWDEPINPPPVIGALTLWPPMGLISLIGPSPPLPLYRHYPVYNP